LADRVPEKLFKSFYKSTLAPLAMAPLTDEQTRKLADAAKVMFLLPSGTSQQLLVQFRGLLTLELD